MNLQELASPIRMYWDIGPSPSLTYRDYRRIADEIAANKLLTLQITETSPGLSGPSLAVLEALRDKPVALSLVVPLSALDVPVLDLLHAIPLKVLFVQTASLDGLGRIAELAGASGGKTAVGVSFPVTRENFRTLPELLNGCIEREITQVLLPMQRPATGVECFTFSRKEREELTAELGAITKPAWLKITIHDPFLWRAVYPDVEFPNGGCQAANTMLYISPDAEVYPCPMLPVKIGSLLTSSLGEVIRSDRKKGLRKTLLEGPDVCRECGELGQCRGGCRGRAYVMQGTMNGPDPACR